MTTSSQINVAIPGPVKDFELSLHIRNNHLKKRRLALGLTKKQLAEKVGIGYQTYCKLEDLRISPLLKRPPQSGVQWKPTTVAIAKFYECSEDELWPGAVLAVTVPEIITEIGGEQLLAAGHAHNLLPSSAPSPIDVAQAGQLSVKIDEVLNELTDEEAEMLRLRFGLGRNDGHGLDLKEIGRVLPKACGAPRSRERVRQIEARILSKLRHPSFSSQLEPFYNELPGDPIHRVRCRPDCEHNEQETNRPAASKRTTKQAIRRAHIKKRLDDLGLSIEVWSETNKRRHLCHLYQEIFNNLYRQWSNNSKLRAAIIIRSSRWGKIGLNTTTDLADVAALFTPGSGSSRLSDVKQDNKAMADAIMELADKAVFLVLLCDSLGSELFCVPV